MVLLKVSCIIMCLYLFILGKNLKRETDSSKSFPTNSILTINARVVSGSINCINIFLLKLISVGIL